MSICVASDKRRLVKLIALFFFAALVRAPAAMAASAPQSPVTSATKIESLDEQYEKAKKEGGQLTLYVALSNRSQEVILTELQ